MGRINKPFALILILTIAMSCLTLLMVKPANAQSKPIPSVPQFNAKYVDYSYDTLPQYSIDQHIGQNVTIQAGYHIENKSIEVMIENQPFTPETDPFGIYRMYYNVSVKGHNEANQHYYYNYEDSLNDYILASNSKLTVLVFGLKSNNGSDYYKLQLANIEDGKVDFQVQAFFGYSHNGVFVDTQTSKWSPTQTVTIPQSNTSTNPTPSVPEFSWLTILPILLAIPIALAMVRKRLEGNV